MNTLTEEIKRMVETSPAIKSGTKAYGTSWTLTIGGVLNIYGNLIDDEFVNTVQPGDVRQIQFARKFNVTKETLEWIDTFLLKNNSAIHLRETFNEYGAFENLDFLQYLPKLKSLGFQAFHKLDLTPVSNFVTLDNLGLGGYNIPLHALKKYDCLKTFWFGDKIKDYESISHISSLEEITVMSQQLKSLEFLFPLQKLSKLSFSFGSTTFYDELPELKKIEALDFWRIRKLEVENIYPVNRVKQLKVLKLRELPRISALHWIQAPHLNTLVLQEMKGLKTYESLLGPVKIDTLVIADLLTKEKIDSLGEAKNINHIQIFPGYYEDKNHYIYRSKIADKVQKLESKYHI